MVLNYSKLYQTLKDVLYQYDFDEEQSEICATIFAQSTIDGYHSHGINRFAEFLKTLTDGYIQLDSKPERLLSLGNFERWDAKLGPGPLNAHFAVNRAVELAKENGMACVALQNSSHWMRGGSYGWQAAEAGCIGICFTNTEPNMPSWGSKSANTGNNPVIVSVPHEDGHIVLDMSLSQFSYGKMWQLDMEGEELPFPGGFNEAGELTTVPKDIVSTRRLLPTGYWKGSGLSIMVDLLSTLLSAGRSTCKIGELEAEFGLSQVFICLDASQMNTQSQHYNLVNEILSFVQSATPVSENDIIEYPGSRTRKRREKHMKEGVEVNDEVWNKVIGLLN